MILRLLSVSHGTWKNVSCLYLQGEVMKREPLILKQEKVIHVFDPQNESYSAGACAYENSYYHLSWCATVPNQTDRLGKRGTNWDYCNKNCGKYPFLITYMNQKSRKLRHYMLSEYTRQCKHNTWNNVTHYH